MNRLICSGVNVVFASFFLSVSWPVTRAAVIGFDGIPDGTPVSAGNPYAGVLTIDARAGWIIPYLPLSVETWFPAVIVGEKIDTTLGGRNAGQPAKQMSEMTATFLGPVTDVSFDGWAWRDASYLYLGVNGAGEAFTGNGIILSPYYTTPPTSRDPNEMVRVNLALPSGYYLNSFTVKNQDYGSGYDFRVDNIQFTLASAPDGGQPVPEGGPTALLLGMSCMALVVLRKRLRPAS